MAKGNSKEVKKTSSKVTPAKAWIKEYSLQVSRYSSFCKGNDWTQDPQGDDGYELQNNMILFLLNRLKHFVGEYESYQKFKYVQDFKQKLLSPILAHLERSRKYRKDVDFTVILDPELRAEEITFQQSLMKHFNTIKDTLQSLNLDDEVSTIELPIREDKKIPPLMSGLAMKHFDDVPSTGVSASILDINSIKTSPELFINMKNPPKYDSNLHYFEQSDDVLQFFSEELYKLTFGLNINGIFIHPWLYWHINYMITDIPMAFFKGTPQYDPSKKVLDTNPSLRDNEWYFAESYAEADEKDVGLFMFGTRRFSKTVIESSVLSWITSTVQGSESVVIGGDSGDLDKLGKCLEKAFINVNPYFQLPRISTDWGKRVQFGFKTRSNKNVSYSDIFIRNIHKGTASGGEKSAGVTPTAWILDEAGKFNSKTVYEAGVASFQNVDGWALVPILSGTGGNEKLSRDAQEMLLNPEANHILPMNWDRLDRLVKEEDLITWTRKSFGTFVPAQMSFKAGLRKKLSNLSDFLEVDSEDLAKIEIRLTNWEKAKEILERDRELKNADKESQAREMMSYPLDPLDCFLNNTENPFPAVEAMAHREDLIRTGNTGRLVEFHIDPKTGEYKYTDSSKVPANYPFKGGNHDAPVRMFNPPHENNDMDGTYVAGLDHYKQNKSGTDSLGSYYVFKRGVDLSDWSYRIVASYVSRPNTMDKFNSQVEKVMKAYGAETLQENIDISFQQHLERKNEASMWLACGDDLVKTMISARSQQNNKYGLFPTARNQAYILGLVISYCQEEVQIGTDDLGNPITVKGVVRIPDIDLLQEIINFNYTGNFDRIISFGHALAWDRYLTRIGVMPAVKTIKREEYREVKSKIRKRSPLNHRRGSMYSTRR